MPEPTTGSFLGIKYLTLLAGFAGGVISLSFVRSLTPWQMPFAVLAGLCTAAFLAPAMSEYFKWSANIEAALGFALGITAMSVVPGIIALAEKFREDPVGFVTSFFKKRGE